MNIFCQPFDLIQLSTAVLSVQIFLLFTSIVISVSQKPANSAPNVAASTSNLQKLICLIGATLDLLMT